MPNHTANILEIEDAFSLEVIQEAMRGEYEENGETHVVRFDFNQIFPMPPELENTKSPATVVATQEEADEKNEENRKRFGDSPFGMGRILCQAESDDLIKQFGANNWYDWKCDHWGTKWGAYGIGEWNDNTLYFETAWSPPEPIILRLSEMFPEARFTLKFADEGGGFLGYAVYVAGVQEQDINIDWQSEEGVALRQDLGRWYEDEEEGSDEDVCDECEKEFIVDLENEAHIDGYCSTECMEKADAKAGLILREKCIEDGKHLTDCNDDGACRFCGQIGE
jgi:hypothetical protein